MKFSLLSLGLLASSILAAPTPTSDEVADAALIVKRASISDVCSLSSFHLPFQTSYMSSNNPLQAATGFASQNGGTTGGRGGTTTTVSTYAQFTAAVASDAKKVVVVTGTITQAASQARVGSNTSIIGKNSGAKLVNFGL
jgi:pectate lyase